jgi:NADP-dependent 3-hydroxy acid dehydrogenase YdfG
MGIKVCCFSTLKVILRQGIILDFPKMANFVTNHKKPYAALSPAHPGRSLAGKSVFITGAGRGVGEHITHGLAAAGPSRIGILGRDKSRIENAKAKFAKEYPGTAFSAYSVDILDETGIAAVFKDFGAPDILINNAGHFPDEGPFIKQELKSWFSGFEINILGTAIVTQKYLQAKGAEKPGVVLNVSSMAAHMRFPLVGWSGYNGSKMGQTRIFENIRFEHPEVRFISIHPGNIESDGFTRSGASAPPGGMTDGKLAGQFFAWAATTESDFLSGRFVWAEWDITELKAKKDEILKKDLLLTTIDGFDRGFF